MIFLNFWKLISVFFSTEFGFTVGEKNKKVKFSLKLIKNY